MTFDAFLRLKFAKDFAAWVATGGKRLDAGTVLPEDIVSRPTTSATELLAGVHCPAYGLNGCRHEGECVGSVCVAAERGEKKP